MKKNLFVTGHTICWIVAIIILLPFLAISLFNHPVGDDYWCTALVRKMGYWKAQFELYNIVPPRYTELAISCATPLSFGNFSGYRVIPIAFVLLFIYILSLLFKLLFSSRYLTKSDRYLPAFVFVAIYLSILHGIGEGIYWTSALVVYHTGIVLFLIWLCNTLKWYFGEDKKKRHFLLSVLSVIGILGCNEIISCICLFLVLFIGAFLLIKKKRTDTLMVTQLVAAGVCMVIAMQFSGISNRYNLIQTETSGRVGYSIVLSILGMGYYMLKYLLNPFFWAMIIVAEGPFRVWAKRFHNKYHVLFNYPLYFLFTGFVILFIIFFVIIFLTGHRPPLRITNIMVIFFLLYLTYFSTWLLNRKTFNIRLLKLVGLAGKYKVLLVILLLAVGFQARNNVSIAAKELVSGTAYRYDQEMSKRYELIRQCQTDTCVIPPLKNVSTTLRYDVRDIDSHIGEYFNKQIRIAGD